MDQIEIANGAIASAENALDEFDLSLQAMDVEAETAAEHAWRADSALEEARAEKERIKERQAEEMNKRHDLQVGR